MRQVARSCIENRSIGPGPAQDPRLILLITIQTPTDDASRTEVADHQLSFVATWPFERLLSIRHEPLMLR